MTKRFSQRFDGAAAFSKLPLATQTEIGGLALEIVLVWNGQDASENPQWSRPFQAGEPLLLDKLQSAVEDAISDVLAPESLPVPSRLGSVCEVCGWSDEDVCDTGRSWASATLCSVCEADGPADAKEENP